MNYMILRIEDVLGQSVGAILLGVLATAGSLFLLHHLRPKPSPRKVRVDRDYTPYRRRSR